MFNNISKLGVCINISVKYYSLIHDYDKKLNFNEYYYVITYVLVLKSITTNLFIARINNHQLGND